MNRLLLLVFTGLLFSWPAYAQVLPCPSTGNPYNVNAGPDGNICIGICDTLNASSTVVNSPNYTVDTMAYTPYPYTGGTLAGITTDDVYSPLITLPFPFCFYGVTYTTCVIGANGHVNFNAALAGTGSGYVLNGGLPNGAAPVTQTRNAIMGAIYDIHPGLGGTISYATYGIAPCRKFVVSFNAVPLFSCTNVTATQQIVLHETTGEINVHIQNKPTCSWNGGNAIIGVQNATGTSSTAPAGYNGGSWSVTNKSWVFTPPTSISYVWKDALGAVIGTGPSVVVCPPDSTFFTLEGLIVRGCDTFTSTDIVNVNVTPVATIDSVTAVNPATCGGQGSITLHGLDPNTAYIITLDRNGAPMPPFNVTTGPGGSTTILVPSGNYSNIKANQTPCFSNTVGPVVILDPPITAGFNYQILWGCTQDTIVFDNFSATPGGLTHLWNFGDGTQDTARNPIKIYPTQGLYTVKLRVTNGVCADSIQESIDTRHPLIASFTQSADSFCQGGTVTFTNTSVTTIRNGIAPKWFWTFGDGGTDTVKDPTYTFTRAGVWPVLLTVTDFVPCVDTASSVIVIDSIPFISITADDSSLCEGQAVQFTGNFLQLNNTGYIWDFGDGSTPVTDRNPVTHGYDASGIFNVTLTASYRICNDTSFVLPIEIRPYTSINIGRDTSICPGGEPLQLSARLADGSLAPGSAIVRWSTGDTASSILVRHEGEYWAVADLRGCTSADSLVIAKDCYLDLPNTFTANGDGINDYFWPRQFLSEGITSFRMTIFNRWGQKIWETTSIDGRGWDGRYNGEVQPAGVYLYFVEAELKNGIREKYQGNVTLLR